MSIPIIEIVREKKDFGNYGKITRESYRNIDFDPEGLTHYSSNQSMEIGEFFHAYKTKWKDFRINTKLSHIEDAIEDAKYISTLESGWDGENAIPPPIHILERAVNFVRNYSYFVRDKFDIVIVAPHISPLRDGSIDLSWTASNGYLLINIKNTTESVAYYYGEMYEDNKKIIDANGEISPDNVINTFVSWFTYLSQMESKKN
jgi:hypothetical protein